MRTWCDVCKNHKVCSAKGKTKRHCWMPRVSYCLGALCITANLHHKNLLVKLAKNYHNETVMPWWVLVVANEALRPSGLWCRNQGPSF